MNTRDWCRRCEFETVHEDGHCTICVLFETEMYKESPILVQIREESHPEVHEELGDETGG